MERRKFLKFTALPVAGLALGATATALAAKTAAFVEKPTADDQRRWEGIVRDWDQSSDTILTQINRDMRKLFPDNWDEPYGDFVYGFTGMKPSYQVMGLAGQWVAARRDPELHLYVAVPGLVGGEYHKGDTFDIAPLFSRENLRTPEGFAELWAAVRAGQQKIIKMMDEA